MSETSKSLSIRYINKLFLQDDYGRQGVIYTNYKVSVIKKWIALFKHSKHCCIEHDPPIRHEIRSKWNPRLVELIESEPAPIQVPAAVILSKEYRFDLEKFVDYLNSREYDIEYLTREEYEKEHQVKRPFMMPRKRKRT